MRNPRLSAAGFIAASLFLAVACGPVSPGSTATAAPTRASELPGTTGSAAPDAASEAPDAELVRASVWSPSISVGVPADWVVLDQQRMFDLERQLRPTHPELADLYVSGYTDGVEAVDMAALPEAFSSLSALYSCNDTESAADRLEYLRHPVVGEVVEASVIELPAGDVAAVSIIQPLGSFTLRLSVYSYWAPTTDCDGAVLLVIRQSVPDPPLVEAIARSVTIESTQGTVTLELRDSIVLTPTEFPVTCERLEGVGTKLSSGLAVKGMTVGLAVDELGQPTFFLFANETLSYFSGKGFDASEALTPEPGSLADRGAATFEGILPPDDPAHPLSGRVSWRCAA